MATSYAFQSVFGPLLFANFAPAHQTDALAYYCDAIGIGIVDPVYTLVADVGVDGQPGYVPGYGSLFDPSVCPLVDLPYLAQFVGVTIPDGTDEVTARSLVIAEAGKNRGTIGSIRGSVERSISTPWAPLTTYAAGVIFTEAGVYYKVSTTFTSGATFAFSASFAVVDVTSQYQVIERFAPPGTYVNTLAAQWQRAEGSWQSVSPAITWASWTGTPNSPAYQLTVVVQPGQLTPSGNTAALVAAITANKPAGILLYVVANATPEWFQATKTWAAVAGTVQWGTVQNGDV
jgi:hypothetical protein